MLNINGGSFSPSEGLEGIALRKSIEKKYFVGRSTRLDQAIDTKGYAELRNPADSGIDIHINVWTVTNFEAGPFRANLIFNADIATIKTASNSVSVANRSAPIATPKAEINVVANTTIDATGIIGFRRSIPGKETIVDNEEGKFIIPPGEAWGIQLVAFAAAGAGEVAFGWWEEPL